MLGTPANNMLFDSYDGEVGVRRTHEPDELVICGALEVIEVVHRPVRRHPAVHHYIVFAVSAHDTGPETQS